VVTPDNLPASDLPHILCTGFSDLIDKGQALAIGIRACLTKPPAMHDLSRTVREVLDAQSKEYPS